MQVKKTDIAWAAGILDGEGCIAIIRYNPTPGTRCVEPRFVLHVKVTMGHRPTIDRLAEIFGHGTVQTHVARSERVNASYSWVAQSRKGEHVLTILRPYLLTKAAEADVALRFMELDLSPRGGKGGSTRTQRALLRDRERLYWRLRKLKSRWRFYAEKLKR